ncbi:MAG: ATP-binding protein [Balneolales bacterium]|nr:ATP-binding protein [Balneolales bacterium]
MKHFEAYNLGQIKEASIELGDFTVFIGPQASGKSILLQLFKLLLDGGNISKQMKNHGVQLKNDAREFFDLYMGEGMGKILRANSLIKADGRIVDLSDSINGKENLHDRVAYVPAQRVLAMAQGWPRPYSDFRLMDPYVLKSFSSRLQVWLDFGVKKDSGMVFPHQGIMDKDIESLLNKAIYVNASVNLDQSSPQMRLMLDTGESQLSYLGWSAGQREFTPLLMQIYWLLQNSNSGNIKGKHHQFVIIEEPEMGLHPMAIEALMLSFLELISRGYKVIVSTHSTTILQLCWAVGLMQKIKAAPDDLFELFGITRKSTSLRKIFENIVTQATFNTYYFDRKADGVVVRDISRLDPADEDQGMSEWGGLTAFGSKASEIISNLIASKDEF